MCISSFISLYGIFTVPQNKKINHSFIFIIIFMVIVDLPLAITFIFIFISRGFFHGLNQLYSFDKNGFQTVFCPRIFLDIGMTQENDVSGRSVFWRRLTETCQNLNVSPRYSPTFLTVHYTGQIISQYCPVRADLMSQTHRNEITGDFQNLNSLDKMV